MKKFLKFLIILIIFIALGVAIYLFFFKGDKDLIAQRELFENTNQEYAEINKYYVYGTHLNIMGTINKKLYEDNILNAELVFKTIDKKEKSFKIEYQLSDDNKFIFTTSDNINEGINLEDLPQNNYYAFIKIKERNFDKDSNETEKNNYYSLINKTKYKNIKYYTLTKESKNNEVNIKFDKITFKTLEKKYMNIMVNPIDDLKNVYDIAIDAGHGGKDGGAVVGVGENQHAEKDITLDYAKSLKEELEKMGLKIKLTRDGTNEENLGIYDMYGKNGRAVIPNKVKAKYLISLHLNSTEYKILKGGIEIYAPSNAKLEFASLLADNLVKYAKTTYSQNVSSKVENGVYVRNFTKNDIENSKADAKKSGYNPYNLTTDTPYLFMIREPGGIATNAYVDGRNKLYDSNPYYNSNIGVESYLIELGFMNSNSDLNNILNNKSLYIKGITESIKNYLNL